MPSCFARVTGKELSFRRLCLDVLLKLLDNFFLAGIGDALEAKSLEKALIFVPVGALEMVSEAPSGGLS